MLHALLQRPCGNASGRERPLHGTSEPVRGPYILCQAHCRFRKHSHPVVQQFPPLQDPRSETPKVPLEGQTPQWAVAWNWEYSVQHTWHTRCTVSSLPPQSINFLSLGACDPRHQQLEGSSQKVLCPPSQNAVLTIRAMHLPKVPSAHRIHTHTHTNTHTHVIRNNQVDDRSQPKCTETSSVTCQTPLGPLLQRRATRTTPGWLQGGEHSVQTQAHTQKHCRRRTKGETAHK